MRYILQNVSNSNGVNSNQNKKPAKHQKLDVSNSNGVKSN